MTSRGSGDKVLHDIGKIVLNSIRIADFSARYGGEEMAVILPDTSLDQAVLLAEKLRLQISNDFAEGDTPVTVSIGISSTNVKDFISSAELICKADRALYVAKTKGKNQVATIE
jgi:diguanylate cyclase (GGDEF)-like protein